MDALRGLIRSGAALTDEQRDHLAQVLDAVGDAVSRYAELLAAVSR